MHSEGGRRECPAAHAPQANDGFLRRFRRHADGVDDGADGVEDALGHGRRNQRRPLGLACTDTRARAPRVCAVWGARRHAALLPAAAAMAGCVCRVCVCYRVVCGCAHGSVECRAVRSVSDAGDHGRGKAWQVSHTESPRAILPVTRSATKYGCRNQLDWVEWKHHGFAPFSTLALMSNRCT